MSLFQTTFGLRLLGLNSLRHPRLLRLQQQQHHHHTSWTHPTAKAFSSPNQSSNLRFLHTSRSIHDQPPRVPKKSTFEFYSASHKDIDDSCYDSLTDEQRMTLVKTEYELYKQEGDLFVPSEINDNQWGKLVAMNTVPERIIKLKRLYLNEFKRNAIIKNNEMELARLAKYKEECTHLIYGYEENCYFDAYSPQYIENIKRHKLITAALFGQPIIIDCGFESDMSAADKRGLVQQLGMSLSKNRNNNDPFYVHMCNYDSKSFTAKMVQDKLPHIFVDQHKENYLGLFPNESLVYLTPDCEDLMDEYDHDAIYILGGTSNNKIPSTLAKAKAEGITMKKFPIDVYVEWGRGPKSLPLSQVMGILLDLKQTGCWTQAFHNNVRTSLVKMEHNRVSDRTLRYNKMVMKQMQSILDEVDKR